MEENEKISLGKIVGEMVEGLINSSSKVVYFVRCNNYVKIGSTTGMGFAKRFHDLQCGNPYKLSVDILLKDNGKLEKFFHKLLIKRRIRGEWFEAKIDEVYGMIFYGIDNKNGNIKKRKPSK